MNPRIITSFLSRQAALRFFCLLTPVLTLGATNVDAAESARSASLSATDTAPMLTTGPRIHFAEPAYDFGKVDSGQVVKYEFVFTNTGNAILEVTNVHPACGCTAAGTWDKQVEPGKTGRIPIQFNSFGYGGQVHKAVTVWCNDPTQTKVMLDLQGTVWKPIDVQPAYAMFNLRPDVQTNQTKVIKILNNLDEPVAVSEPVCTNHAFRTALKTVREGKEYELSVTLVPPVGPDTASAAIDLKTSSSRVPVLTVKTYAVMQSPITITPMQIMLPPGPLTNTIQRSVTIRNNTTNAIALSEPSANADGVAVSFKEIQPGHIFSLLAAFPAGFQSAPARTTSVTVKSTQPRFPLITIPVFQREPINSAQESGGGLPTPKVSASRVLPARPGPVAMQHTTVGQ